MLLHAFITMSPLSVLAFVHNLWRIDFIKNVFDSLTLTNIKVELQNMTDSLFVFCLLKPIHPFTFIQYFKV